MVLYKDILVSPSLTGTKSKRKFCLKPHSLLLFFLRSPAPGIAAAARGNGAQRQPTTVTAALAPRAPARRG